jgi:F-type H+-transporting ATPase subunit epsilon
MPRKFSAQLMTPQGVKYEGEVIYLRLPALDGSFGVEAGHASLIAALAPGEILVTPGLHETPIAYANGGGVVEVRDNRALVLADSLETPEEIDAERAREAADRARERLATKAGENFDAGRAEAALERALVRLKVAERPSGRGESPIPPADDAGRVEV